MKHLSKKRAFTLVEIMIVVLIIGILLAMAVPNFMKARETSRTNACVNNLKAIQDAKDQWAMDNRKEGTDTPLQTELAPNYIKVFPANPDTGQTYTVNNMATTPTCSFGAPHVLG